MLLNLMDVTNSALSSQGKTWGDVEQVQASGEWFQKDEVEELMKKTLFDPMAAGDEVPIDLVLVGNGWAFRWENRGWVWMQVPEVLPEEKKGECPVCLSTRDEVDQKGHRIPVYGKNMKEMKKKPQG